MATASSKTGAGAGDGNDPADAERMKKLEKIKKEIRSILITAQQTGRSPEELERDYRDLNGRPIPYKDLGYDSIFLLLDAMPDVVDAYQTNGTNEIVLFAKSSKATEHLEYLISKAKPSRLSRFGGVIPQAPECRRGTPERRKLIENRLIDVASQYYPHFVSYLDLCNAYQGRYFEPLDPKGDFNCPAKTLFNLKLEHAFEIQGGSGAGGHFSVRVKKPVQSAVANKENVSGSDINVLGAGGFGQHNKSQESVQPQQRQEAVAAMAAAEAVAQQMASTSMSMPQQSHVLEDRRENIPTAGVPLYAMHPEQMIRPVHPIFMPAGPAGLPVRLPYPFMPYGTQMMMPFQVQVGQRPPLVLSQHVMPPFPPAQNWIGPPAHQVVFATGPFNAPAAPHFIPGPRFVIHPQQGGNQFMPVYHCPPVPAQQQESHPVAVTEVTNQQRPAQRDSADSGLGRVSSNGALDAMAPPFEPKSSSSGSSAMVTARDSMGPPSAASTVPKTKAPSPLVSSQVVPDMNESQASQRRQLLDETRASTMVGSTASVTAEPLRASSLRAEDTPRIGVLKEECRRVLRRYPNGVSYLQFEKLYREVNEKELDLGPLAALDVLSVMELAEMWTDVFRISNQGREVLLFSNEPYPSMREHDRNASAQGQVDQWVESTGEDALIAELWRVAMGMPDRTLYKRQIASEYQKATGKRFPIPESDLDMWALRLFDYTDRFEFLYEGELRCIALPDYDDFNFENADSRIATVPIPNGFAQHGDTLPTQPLPISPERLRILEDASDPGRFFRVILAQVETPGKFYVQLESTWNELELLSSALNDYFSASPLSTKAKVCSSNAKVGLLCAVRSDDDNMWYRGLIKDVSQDGSMTVFLIDHGTEISSILDEIRYLPRGFLKLPAQAIEARLAALTPVGQAWTTDAGDRLTEICGTSFMWAELFKFNADGVPEILLTLNDDNGEELHINDDLINSGFALFDEAELIEAGLNHMDLEHEIDSPEGSPTQANLAEDGGEQQEEETPEKILNTELEQQVVSQLRQAVENEGNVPVEDVLYMAKMYLSRRRLAIWNLLTQPIGQNLISLAVDKVKWLEGEIQWLDRLIGQ